MIHRLPRRNDYPWANGPGTAGGELVTYRDTGGYRQSRSAATASAFGDLTLPGYLLASGLVQASELHVTDGVATGVQSDPLWHPSGAGASALAGVVIAAWNGAAALSLGALVANRAYFMVLRPPPSGCEIDEIYTRVQTAAGSGTLRMGIYESAGERDITPTGAPIAESGTISVTSTGVKTYTFPAPIVLRGDRVYPCFVGSDSTPTLIALAAASVERLPVDVADLTTRRYGLQVASWTYAALPTSPSVTWITSGTLPAIAVRVSG